MENWIWLFLVLALSMIEITTINLVTIWFIISALVALVLSFFITNQTILFAIFAILGIVLMITTRPLLKKYLISKKEATNLDRVIGLVGVVTEEINDGEIGEVKVDGKRWSATSKENIKCKEKVIIEDINGVKLIVRKED